MKSDYFLAALLVAAVAIGLGANIVYSQSEYCPKSVPGFRNGAVRTLSGFRHCDGSSGD